MQILFLIIFATGNENKMKEIRMILQDLPCEILSMKEAGILADIVEDGSTILFVLRLLQLLFLYGDLEKHKQSHKQI